jgi:hypothetical protein
VEIIAFGCIAVVALAAAWFIIATVFSLIVEFIGDLFDKIGDAIGPIGPITSIFIALVVLIACLVLLGLMI